MTGLLFFISGIKYIGYLKGKNPFPKSLLLMAFSICLIGLSLIGYHSYFFTFDRIDKDFAQTEAGPILSPTEKYTANAYYEPYGGAAGGVNVWVEITEHEMDEVKTIYYSDAKSEIRLEWEDEETLYVKNIDARNQEDRSIALNVGEEIYDELGLACKSLLMKGKYKSCYQN